jgi:hypothetical protein
MSVPTTFTDLPNSGAHLRSTAVLDVAFDFVLLLGVILSEAKDPCKAQKSTADPEASQPGAAGDIALCLSG